MLSKYLDMCEINIKGYIQSKNRYHKAENVYILDNIKEMHKNIEAIVILLAVSDRYFNEILREIEQCGFRIDNIFILSEYNKHAISEKMTPWRKENM